MTLHSRLPLRFTKHHNAFQNTNKAFMCTSATVVKHLVMWLIKNCNCGLMDAADCKQDVD